MEDTHVLGDERPTASEAPAKIGVVPGQPPGGLRPPLGLPDGQAAPSYFTLQEGVVATSSLRLPISGGKAGIRGERNGRREAAGPSARDGALGRTVSLRHQGRGGTLF